MSEKLIDVFRGSLVESIHRGDAVAVNSSGKIIACIGDPYKLTYMRSSSKPLQAMNVILSGAADRFNFNDAELSIMCASHYGEIFHQNTVKSILNKINLKVSDLLCGTTLSLNPEYTKKLLKENSKLSPLNTDCSGKHAGMLATCLQKGYDIKNYNCPNHPLQKELKKLISEICEISEAKIIIGTDGCTVPVFGMPLYNMALGYAKISTGKNLNQNYKNAANRVFKAMNAHPEMIAGTNGFCTELIKNTHGKLIGKLGSEGVYCIGIKNKDIGLALKIEDGNNRALSPSVMQCLEDLNILDENEKNNLSKFKILPNLNNIKSSVGEIRPVFHLKKLY